jgi:outer membrane protein OmpA-like peptidoglycan-associated protein
MRSPERQAGRISLASILQLVGLAGIALFALLFFIRLSKIETRLTAISNGMKAVTQKTEEASRESQAARLRASQAEENALEAGRARSEAELEKLRAESAARSAESETAALRTETEELRRKQAAELDRLQKALSRVVETRRTALGLVMSLGSESIKFDFDQARLKPEDRELLSRIAGILLTSSDYRIDVYGHTDDIGTEEYNQGLSERRAQAVRDYLVEAGVDPAIISTKGFGKSQPRVAGAGPEARAKNRRVEIAVVNTRIVDLEATGRNH